jgi:DnaA family protein
VSAQLALNVRLRDGSSFENFLPARNGEVVALLQAVCAALAGNQPPPAQLVVLVGAEGSGRTHLLEAACREAQDTGHGAFYISARAVRALGPALLEGAEQLALVCVDDVEALVGDAAWEQALFTLLERRKSLTGGALIVAAKAPPVQLGFTLRDLVSRLCAGVVYVLEPLGDDEKLAALQLRARARGLDLPDDVGRYVIARYPRDLASLFALLDRIDTAALASQRRLTIPFLRSLESADATSVSRGPRLRPEVES